MYFLRQKVIAPARGYNPHWGLFLDMAQCSGHPDTEAYPPTPSSVQTLWTQDTSDLPNFGPRTLQHVRSVPTLRHWLCLYLRSWIALVVSA